MNANNYVAVYNKLWDYENSTYPNRMYKVNEIVSSEIKFGKITRKKVNVTLEDFVLYVIYNSHIKTENRIKLNMDKIRLYMSDLVYVNIQ